MNRERCGGGRGASGRAPWGGGQAPFWPLPRPAGPRTAPWGPGSASPRGRVRSFLWRQGSLRVNSSRAHPPPLALLLPLPTPSTPQASRPGVGLTPASVGASTWPRGLSPPGPSDSSHRCGPHIILQTQSPWPPLAFPRGFLTRPVTQGSWTLPELRSPHDCPSLPPALSS